MSNALEIIREMESLPKVISKPKQNLSIAEKLIIIKLLQSAKLFPTENQTTSTTGISELVAALTGISNEAEVRKNLTKIGILFNNKEVLTDKQKPEKRKNINNIKPILAKLNNKEIENLLIKIEDKVKN